MADISNILAMGPQPTTQWQNPLDMQVKQQQIKAQQAQIREAEQLGQAREFEMQQKREAQRLAQQQRDAWIKAGQEAAGDPKKYVDAYLRQTGDQAGANAALKSLADYQDSLTKQGEGAAKTHEAQSKRAAGILEAVMAQPAQMRRGAYQQAQMLAKQEGIDLPDFVDAEGVQFLRDLHLMQGTLASEKAKEAELAQKAAAEDRTAQQFATEQPVREAIAADTLADPNHLNPQERSEANARTQAAQQAMYSSDYKDFLKAKEEGYKGSWLEYQTKMANLKQPTTNVTVNNNPEGLLTPAEAGQLGVPYGTPRKAAFGITPSTEGERVAATYAERMNQANSALSKFEKQATGAGQLVYQELPNVLKPEVTQEIEQAKRNFLNAVLRKESGAVINPAEMEEANKQYFPLPGDSPAVVKLKAQNRDTAIKGMYRSAGGASAKPTKELPGGITLDEIDAQIERRKKRRK